MTINKEIGILIIVLIVILGIWITLASRRRKWYKVFLANNEVLVLYRDLNERWWRTNDKYMRFKDEQGKEFTFPTQAHWILYWVSVDDVAVAKREVQQLLEMRKAEEAER